MMRDDDPALHYPDPRGAALLTLAALAVSLVVSIVLTPGLGLAAAGVAIAAGLGGVGTLAAQRVPPPHAERLGLRGFEPRFLGTLFLLLPAVFLVSELDNLASSLFPSAENDEWRQEMIELVAGLGPVDRLQFVIVAVGITPVVREWFFRGVLQQGLIAHMGQTRGLLFTAMLATFASFSFGGSGSVATTIAALVAAFALSLLLGALRLCTGSLLAPILLSAASQAITSFATLYPERLPIQGFNVPGDHSSPGLLLAATIAVGLGVRAILHELAAVPDPLPIAEDDAKRNGNFG